MMVALSLLVLLLAGAGGWRLWVMSQDIAVMDRDLGRLHEQLGQMRQARAEMAHQADGRHRQAEVSTARVQGELSSLRQRVEVIEPWVRLWAMADERG